MYHVGDPPYRVTVYERRAKKGVLYLRWRAENNWKHQSLGKPLRTKRGRIIKAIQRWAIEEATRCQRKLLVEDARRAVAERRDTPAIGPTVAESQTLICDPEIGRYPVDTAHRRSVIDALQFAGSVWGADRRWPTLRKGDYRALGRAKIRTLAERGHTGYRGAEIVVTRVLTTVRWLQGEGLVPRDIMVPAATWREELKADWRQIRDERKDPEPDRPRHTLEEMRAILAVAHRVDPRFGLMAILGGEQRMGQVRRARRSDLDLPKRAFRIPGMGRKKGNEVLLTEGQMAAVTAALTTGYLRKLEAKAMDYWLFPGGYMSIDGERVADDRHLGRAPVKKEAVLKWFRKAEALAGVPHIKGRATYGIRRAAVDGAKAERISREGLKELGGWTSSKVPDEHYADQEARPAKEEARDVRARIRKESTGSTGLDTVNGVRKREKT